MSHNWKIKSSSLLMCNNCKAYIAINYISNMASLYANKDYDSFIFYGKFEEVKLFKSCGEMILRDIL